MVIHSLTLPWLSLANKTILGLQMNNNPISSNIFSNIGVGLLGIGFIIISLIIVFYLLKRIIVNSILGIVALFVLKILGFTIPINIITILITVLFGLGGVGVLLILRLFGIQW